MSNEITDFYGKDVAEAIKEACEHLDVAQEHLNIEVLETGSKGIFGLIRQKAHIRVSVQDIEKESEPFEPAPKAEKQKTGPNRKAAAANRRHTPAPSPDTDSAYAPEQRQAEQPDTQRKSEAQPDNSGGGKKEGTKPDEASLALIGEELKEILALMDCPSTVVVEYEDGTVHCRVSDDHMEPLISQEGRILDSLQYLLRKIVFKKIGVRLQLSIDVGDYRENRQRELRELAVQYGAQVKEDGKTQVIASLNPSERRIVHVALQDDPDIRSRSVGDGLFKKVLIYKPGKGRKNSRKRGRSNYRKKNNGNRKQEAS